MLHYLLLHTLTVTVGPLQTVRLEKKLTSLHPLECVMYAIAREEANESSCKTVALCADLEVAEHVGEEPWSRMSC